MEQAILSFAKQFGWQPEVVRTDRLKRDWDLVWVLGMGGSQLGAEILRVIDSSYLILSHRSYGLPSRSGFNKDRVLLVASSYSGNTEEVVSGLKAGVEAGLEVVVISTGGQLEELAEEYQLPLVKIPDTGVQPRSALGFSVKALASVLGLDEALVRLSDLEDELNVELDRDWARQLSEQLRGKVPVVYTSTELAAVGYNWKIKFNETGKIPAFCNVIPELNHNEMTGFDHTEGNRQLSESFYFLFLTDQDDHPQIKKRMEVTLKMYQDRGLPGQLLEVSGSDRVYRVFRSLLLADWTAYETALYYGADSEQVPMIEEFKGLI